MDDQVIKAGGFLLEGGTILYPTDTIWGLGCDATNQLAVHKLYQIKQRPDKKSMLVLMNGLTMLSEYLDGVPKLALEIISSAKKPTTIIYKGTKKFAQNLLAEDGSVGIRIIKDPFCEKLIAFTRKPIVSTSANISGTDSPGSFREIESSIRHQVDYVVKWRQDESASSTPSAILKLNALGEITVIRS